MTLNGVNYCLNYIALRVVIIIDIVVFTCMSEYCNSYGIFNSSYCCSSCLLNSRREFNKNNRVLSNTFYFYCLISEANRRIPHSGCYLRECLMLSEI